MQALKTYQTVSFPGHVHSPGQFTLKQKDSVEDKVIAFDGDVDQEIDFSEALNQQFKEKGALEVELSLNQDAGDPNFKFNYVIETIFTEA